MKRLSTWLMGLAVFGTSVALADPTLPPPSATSTVPNAGCCAPQVPCLGNCCDNGGCCCEHLGGLIGGGGLYLVQPCFSNNPSYAVVSSPTTVGGASTISRVDVNQHMDVAPEIWLGYIGDNGFGGRARWWYFRQDSSQSLAFPAASGGTTIDVFSAAPLGVPVHAFNDDGPLTFNDTTKLQLDVFDVEALQDIQVAGFDLLFSAGLRFAHINQQYNAFGTFTEVVEPLSSVISSHSFNGLGPVVDLEARRAIGNSGLVLYGCARGALLFGSEHQTFRCWHRQPAQSIEHQRPCRARRRA